MCVSTPKAINNSIEAHRTKQPNMSKLLLYNPLLLLQPFEAEVPL